MTINERANEVYRNEDADAKLGLLLGKPARRGFDRYFYDFEYLRGWRQYDTWQDASYFGMWVEIKQRLTFTYCEGDRILVVCPTVETFKAELADAAEFYGDPPAAVTTFGADGSVEKLYDERPTGDPDQVFDRSAINRALAD